MGISRKSFHLFSLIGYPLSHSLSSPMHMAALKKMKMHGLYMTFEIEPKRFATVIKGLHLLPFNGFNVTVPYKEKIIPILHTVSHEARIIGAVNTVKQGKMLHGYNTDAYGFACSLNEDLRFSPRGKSILLIGAGGAARACIYALAKGGAKKIVIADCIRRKAEKLKKHFSPFFKKVQFTIVKAGEQEYESVLPEVDLLVNATPIGLKKTDPLLVPSHIFQRKKLYVYDLIYNPAHTKLLTVARRNGCRTSNGLGMLLHQGAKAFEIWTGKRAPVAEMRRALQKALKSKL
ncbi:MAG: shikimate dehydrogenase [Candidatus Omnitrophica bacterium]|nr:shikimate dehydrogenase [Candidatus Omnitrophota bacterium]